jgi:acetylornithine deacetylase/succinyl-diaminopimelate desuccinylase-like protein
VVSPEDFLFFSELINRHSSSSLMSPTFITHCTLEPEIFPAATDSYFFRNIGIPCFGFSPIRNTPILLHDKNEFLGVSEFLEGIQIYENLIESLARV